VSVLWGRSGYDKNDICAHAGSIGLQFVVGGGGGRMEGGGVGGAAWRGCGDLVRCSIMIRGVCRWLSVLARRGPKQCRLWGVGQGYGGLPALT